MHSGMGGGEYHETERKGERRRMNRDRQNCGIKRLLAARGERKARRMCRSTDILFRVWALTTQAVWGQREAHLLVCDCTGEATVPFPSQRKKWHLSQVQPSVFGFTSPILSSLFLLPSPSPPPLPVAKEKVGGGGGPAGHRQHRGVLFLQLLPAYGGQDAIGSAFRAIWCLSLSNSEQERRQATPPGSASVRWFKTSHLLRGRQKGRERERERAVWA